MVANYAEQAGKRQFDSYAHETDALQAADTLARRLDKLDYTAARLTEDEAREYASARLALATFNVTVAAGVAAVAECLKDLRDRLPSLHAAVSFYKARHKQVTKKPVAEVVAELLKIKESRGASVRYAKDLRLRLERFAGDRNKDCCNVTTADA